MNKRIEKNEVNKGWIEGKKNYPKRDKTQYSDGMRFDVVVVLGMHRSGTSALTKGLELFGVDLGQNLMKANAFNPKGYFEDFQLVQINENILRKSGLFWSTLQFLEPTDLSYPRLEKEQKAAREFLERKLAQGGPIGLKDPRICRTLPLWQKIFVEMGVRVGYVIALRNPYEIAASLQKRDNLPIDYGLTLWCSYITDALRYTEGKSRLFVGFHQLLENSERELTRISEFLETTWNPHAESTLEYQKKFLDSDIRHHQMKKGHSLRTPASQALALALDAVCQKSDKKELENVGHTGKEALLEMIRVSNLIKKNNQISLPSCNSVELFYSKDQGKFSEKRKLINHFDRMSGSKEVINVSLSDEVGLAPYWRVDPGCQPGMIHLLGMKFLNSKGHVVWDLQDDREQVVVSGTATALPHPAVGVELVSTGNDPQVILPKLPSQFLPVALLQIELEVEPPAEAIDAIAKFYAEKEGHQRAVMTQTEGRVKLLEESLEAKKQEAEANSFAREAVEKSLGELKSELAKQRKVQREAIAADHLLVGELAAELKKSHGDITKTAQELINELRELAGKMHERQDHLQQKNLADMEILRTTLERRMSKNENHMQEVARYAGQIQDSVITPSSYMIPAPFSWYAYLYKMLKIRKPSLINKTPTANFSPTRPGFWRRLERSIRKRRKKWVAVWGFDSDWYKANYADVREARVDPLTHYIEYGQKEGRKKNADDRSNAAGQTIATYADWIRLYDTLTNYERNKMKLEIKQMASPPTFSILMPVYNSKPVWLRRAIESVCHQIYPNWELCIVDDASTDRDVTQVLKEMAAKNPRISIQVRSKNGNISRTSNDALSMAQGEWVVLLDHDDELKEDALFWLARAIKTNEKASIVYSDEDKIGEDGVRRDPHFKTEWNPGLLLSYNYFCHLLAIRKDLVNQAGGFREGFEGAQDYDLILRCIEHIDPDTILHVPRVLYHWRIHSQSTASNIRVKYGAREAGARAIADHLARKKIAAKVSSVEGGYRVEYVQIQKPKVTILIPTKDQANLLKTCVDSLLSNTNYQNREIMLIDNKTEDSEARALLLSYQAKGIKVLRDEGSFNYSRLNNLASRVAGGDLLLLLNNDIEPMNSDWLDVMVNEISQKDVGAVGAKLLYPDGNIQHGGVITGLGGVAGHSHKHLSGSFPGYFSRASVTQDLSAVTAACMLIRKEVFVKIGGLDQENLSVAFNDVDLCLKIREQGWRIVWTPFAKLVHHESARRGGDTTPEKQARFASEVAFMKSKWGIKLQQDPHYSPNLTLDNEHFDIACPPRLENKWMI